MKKISLFLTIIPLLSLFALVAGCDEDKEESGLLSLLPLLAAGQCPELALPAGATVMRQGAVFIEGNRYCYYNLKLEYAGKDPAYAMWIPPVNGGVRPAVMVTCPYDYITWNGDNYPGNTEMSARQYVMGTALYMLNNFGVLYVYGRFYTGGSIQNDVDDMVAGLRFLEESTGLVDKARIGIWGGSWGGFEALYGAAYADDGGGVRPRAGVAFFPVSDFSDEVGYVENAAGTPPNSIPDITDDTKRGQFQAFFDPYLTRIKATTGWETWTGSSLAAKLATPFVVIHDEWDTLVPFEQTTALVASSAPGEIIPLYFYQGSDRDLNTLPWEWGHGELREYALDGTPPPAEGLVFGISNSLASAYLFTRLASPDQTQIIIGFDPVALNDFMAYVKEQRCVSGKNMPWAAALLHDMADARILAIDLSDFSFENGNAVVAGAFTTADWGGPAYRDSASVRTALEAGLPACP